jgi:hypothetical protein
LYVNQALTYQQFIASGSVKFIQEVSDKIIKLNSCILKNCTAASKISNECKTSFMESKTDLHESFEKGVGIVEKNRLNFAQSLFNFSTFCDMFSSVINLTHSLFKFSKISHVVLVNLLKESKIIELVLLITSIDDGRFGEHYDWIRIFSQGKNYFLESWIVAMQCLDSRIDHFSSNYSSLVYPSALVLITSLLPGDDYIGFNILQDVLLSQKWIGDEKMCKSVKFLFNDYYFSEESVSYSRSLFCDNVPYRPSCLKFQVQYEISMYPLRLDWIYAPFEKMMMIQTDQINNQNKESNKDILANVCALLSFIKRVEDLTSLTTIPSRISNGTKVVSIIQVFLLNDSEGNEIFRNDELKILLSWSFDKFTSEGPLNLETAFASRKTTQLATQSRFYELYQDLVAQFLAVSFGDDVFSRYLCLPLSMAYPVDYRLHFWTCLDKLLRIVTWDVKDLPHSDLGPFLNPKEKSANLLNIYRTSIDTGLITKSRNPVLYQIAKSHTEVHLINE